MKRILFYFSLCLIFSAATLFAQVAVEAPASCKQCGMDRTFFAHSRMLVVYADGSSTGTCSLHCADVDMRKNSGKPVKALKAADFNSKKLIDARKATWVIGGKKSGVMTSVPKWAFAKRSDAGSFTKEQGGKVASFDEAATLARNE